MSTLGNVSLWLALMLGAWGCGAGIVAARRRDDALTCSATRTPHALLGVLTVVIASLVAGVVRQDFNLAFVAHHLTRALPLPYALGSLGRSVPGVLLVVAWGIALAGSFGRNRPSPQVVSAAVAVLAVITLAFSPFGRLGYTPLEGQGIDPVPRHPLALVELGLIALGLAALAAAAVRSRSALIAAWVLLSAGLGLRFWRGYAVIVQDGSGWLAIVVAVGWVVAGAALYGLPRRRPDQVVALSGLALVVLAALASALTPARVFRLRTGDEMHVREFAGSVTLTGLGVSRFEIPGGVTAAATLDARLGNGRRALLTAEQRRYFDLYGHQVGSVVRRPAVVRGVLFDVRVAYEPSGAESGQQLVADRDVYEVRVFPVAWCAWVGFALMVLGGLLTAGLRREIEQ